MWLHKVRKRKMQFSIIALILFMSTGILAACISFKFEADYYLDSYFNSKKCPIDFTISKSPETTKVLRDDVELGKYINRIETGNAKCIDEDIYVDSQKMKSVDNFVFETEDYKTLGYKIDFSEGKECECPGDGEVWISKTYADAYDLSLNQTLSIGEKGQKLAISAIVVTPQCSTGFMDYYFLFCNQKTFAQVDGMKGYVNNLYAKDDTVTQKDIENHMPKEASAQTVFTNSQSVLSSCVVILSTIFGSVGAVVGIVILFVSMIVIRYLVRSTVMKEYHSIGIYYAIGKSSREITRMYYLAYMIIGAIGSFAGIFLGRPITSYLVKKALIIAGDYKATYISLVVGVCVFVLTLLVLTANVLAELRKVKRVSPVEVLSMNQLSSKEKTVKSVIPNAASSFCIAVNELFKNRGSSILTILVLTVSIFMNLMACCVGYTLSKYSTDRQIWENLPPYDGYVTLNDDKKALDLIKNSKDVEDYVTMTLNSDGVDFEIEGSNLSIDEANPMIYDNFAEKRYENVPFTKGRICLNEGEVTMSDSLLSKLDKKVGDYVTFTKGNKKLDCLITGSYSAMMKGGLSFYIHHADVKRLGQSIKMHHAFIFLKDGVSFQTFEKELLKHTTTAKTYEDFEFINQEGNTVCNIADPICAVIIFAVSCFSILIIINLVYTRNQENRRKHGILKALGFTSGYIRRKSLFSLSIQYLIGMVFAILINTLVSPALFSLACGIYFIRKPMWITVIVCLVMYVVMMVIARMMLMSVKKITPVELMEE